jgi:hypothetical protein
LSAGGPGERFGRFWPLGSNEELIKIKLLPDEQELLLEYGYPFESEKEQLKKMKARGRIGTLSIKPYFLSLLIGDLCYSINKRTTGRIQDELAELCDRLEYIERTGDGSLDIL